jgi:hypothetical protein
MVTGYSRWMSAVLVPSPARASWDGEGAICRWRARKPELTAECQAFRGTLAAMVIVCKAADPKRKG